MLWFSIWFLGAVCVGLLECLLPYTKEMLREAHVNMPQVTLITLIYCWFILVTYVFIWFLFFVSLMVHALIRNRLYPLQYRPWLEVASFLSIVHALIFNLIPSHIANLFSFFSLFFLCVCACCSTHCCSQCSWRPFYGTTVLLGLN